VNDDDKKALAGINMRAALRSVRYFADALEAEPDCALYAMEMEAYAASARVYARQIAEAA
jgi:hypothetical protein